MPFLKWLRNVPRGLADARVQKFENKLLLALLVVLTAFLLRLKGSAALLYYPDEGMVAETSLRLSQGLPLAVGAAAQKSKVGDAHEL